MVSVKVEKSRWKEKPLCIGVTRTSLTWLGPWKVILVCFDCYKYAIYQITYKQWVFIIVLEFGQFIINVWWRLTSWFINHILSIEFTHGRSSESLLWGLFHKKTTSFMRAPSMQLYYLPNAPPLNNLTLGILLLHIQLAPPPQILRPQQKGNLYKTITTFVESSMTTFLIYIKLLLEVVVRELNFITGLKANKNGRIGTQYLLHPFEEFIP